MSYIQRKAEILKLLKEKDACSIHYLSKHLYVSPSTLRRDLISMEEEGMISRYHGGITLSASSAEEDSVNLRRMVHPEKKAKIARSALSHIHDGMVLFLDSSSTVNHLCLLLKRFHNLTVVTNGLHAAQILNDNTEIRTYLCPGLLKPRSTSVIGEFSGAFLQNFHADAVFFSCKAINENGIFEGDDAQAMIKRSMFRHAAQKIMLCDSSKEQAAGYFCLASFDVLDVLITDAPFSPSLTKAVSAAGCRIELA